MTTITLADVAKAAGLSQSTVSRSLSDPDKVNPFTRERVQELAREMGYVPNQVARSLTSGRTNLLGLIVPDIANPFFPPIIKAVQARAGVRGKTVLIADVDENPSEEIERARVMRAQVDGLIVVSPRTPDRRIKALADMRPIVFVNRSVPGSACVIIENRSGIADAIEHLVALGHRRIAYLSGPQRSWSNQQRQTAVREECAALSVELIELGPFEPQMQAGARAGDLVVAAGVTAVIAYDDLIALGLMARLSERGVRVGQDVSVIGVDDSPMSGMAYPTLTSIHVPGREAGARAVDLVLDLINGTADEGSIVMQVETRLVVRGSTNLAP